MNKDTVVGEERCIGTFTDPLFLMQFKNLSPEVQALIQKGEAWEKLREYVGSTLGERTRDGVLVKMDELENS